MFTMKRPPRESERQQYESNTINTRLPTAREIARGLADETGTRLKSMAAQDLARRRYVIPQFVRDHAD